MIPDDLEKETLASLGQHLGRRTFSELTLRLALVAVDLNARQEDILREGSLALALRASAAVPAPAR